MTTAATETDGRLAIPGVDAALGVPGYNLRSRQHLCQKDLEAAGAWLDHAHPLFDVFLRLRNTRIARRKEVYETLFALERLAPELRRVNAVYELSAGHGLFGLFAVLLFPNLRQVVHVDRREPLCYDRARELLAAPFPFVKTRTAYVRARLSDLAATPRGALVVGVHCCGSLTDDVARLAQAADAPFAVIPCCEGRALLRPDERHGVPGEAIPDLVNARRVASWRGWGYGVEERPLPAQVTERPRLFVAARRGGAG